MTQPITQSTTICSLNNPNVKRAAKLCKSASFRAKTGRFIVEGAKLCADAVRFGVKVDALYYTAEAAARSGDAINVVSAAAEYSFIVTPDILKKIANTVMPQGMVCECVIPKAGFTLNDIVSGGRYMVLENVSDPANLGAVARSCEALGVDALVLIGEGGCDMYSPKAQRAAMGALMRLPVAKADADELFLALSAVDVPAYAAALDETALPLNEVDFSAGAAVFIGNEGHGLTGETVLRCARNIIIPIKGGSESLNAAAAAAIIAYVLCNK